MGAGFVCMVNHVFLYICFLITNNIHETRHTIDFEDSIRCGRVFTSRVGSSPAAEVGVKREKTFIIRYNLAEDGLCGVRSWF